MAGSTPTHIPIPKNHADFERKAVVLFREILKDPSVKRLGRDGQEQFGVDLVGYPHSRAEADQSETWIWRSQPLEQNSSLVAWKYRRQ